MAFTKQIMNGVLRRVRKSFAGPPLREPPWFDQPNALSILDQRRRSRGYSDREYENLRKWVKDGYFVVEGLIPDRDIDEMNRDLEAIWTTSTPRPGLKLHGLKLRREDPEGEVSHENLLQVDLPERLRLMKEYRWRIHTFTSVSAPTRKISRNRTLKRWVNLIFNRSVPPSHSINFMFGSEQGLHQDMAVFPIDPKDYLVGVWIAGEDISPDAGPLIYCPGSHAAPLFEGFANYPWTYLRNCTKETMAAYQAHVDRVAERYPRHTFLGKKGDVLFWHGNLLHGGAPVKNPSLSRRSLIFHAEPKGCDKTSQIKGPFNW